MALPKQVAQQLKDVEAIEKQLTAEQEPAPAPEPAANQPDVAPQPQSATPNQPEPEKPATDWEQKYRTLKGMFDAEVPRLHGDNRALKTQLDTLAAELNALKSAPKPEATPPQKLVSDQDVETFGQDLIDLQRRVASEVANEFQAKLDARDAEIDALRKQVQQTGNQVGELTFEQRLNRALPDFEAVNADPKWIEWLDEVDPILRAPRRTLAQIAFDKGDVDALVDYVTLFRKTLTPAPQVNKRQAELERQVAPTRNNSSSSNTEPQGKFYTQAEASAVWNKIRELSIKGKFDEATKLEAEISAATVEGRIR